MEQKKIMTNEGVLIPQGNYLKTNTIPFCDGELVVTMSEAVQGEYGIILAQLEVLGVPYLDALEKQNVFLEHREEIRKLLLKD